MSVLRTGHGLCLEPKHHSTQTKQFPIFNPEESSFQLHDTKWRLEKSETGIQNRKGNMNRNRKWNHNRNRNGKRNLYKKRDNIYLNLS